MRAALKQKKNATACNLTRLYRSARFLCNDCFGLATRVFFLQLTHKYGLFCWMTHRGLSCIMTPVCLWGLARLLSTTTSRGV